MLHNISNPSKSVYIHYRKNRKPGTARSFVDVNIQVLGFVHIGPRRLWMCTQVYNIVSCQHQELLHIIHREF